MTPSNGSVRQRYLAYFRKYQTASAADIARFMNVTPANARHHLASLTADGLIEKLDTRKGVQRGRPVRIYGLSRLTRGDNLTQLVDVLLTDWLNNIGENEIEEGLSRIASQMIENGSFVSGHISKKLGFAVEQLNKKRYQARWEAHGSGPRVIFESCPYASVISNHPELCRMDTKILQNYLDGDVELVARRERGARNTPVCIFAIHEKL
jgi:predicted ArsR family transcriptional regulator